jgi:hypothetical protein
MTILRRRLVFALIVVAAFAAAVYFRPRPVPPGVTVEATPAPELKREETVPVIIDFIKAYKPATKKKLALPQAVQRDADKHVVASTRTPDDERAHTVTTVIDSSTGEFTSYDRVEPLPWLRPNTTTHIGAYYGFKNGSPAVRVQLQQELLRLKALRVEGTASVDVGTGKPDTFVGVGGRFSF